MTDYDDFTLLFEKIFLLCCWSENDLIFNFLLDFTIFLHKLRCIVSLSIDYYNNIFCWMCWWFELSVDGTAHSSIMAMLGVCENGNTFSKE